MNQTEKIELIRQMLEKKFGRCTVMQHRLSAAYYFPTDTTGAMGERILPIPNDFIEALNLLPLSPVEGVTVPYCCPVCGGCGTVEANFYSQMTIGTSASREQCKSCNGTGIIFSPNT